MISRSKATEAVTKELVGMSPPDDVYVIVPEGTIERPTCWVFFYNSKKFLETGVFKYALAGNGPVFVNKHTGQIRFCGAALDPEKLIEDYERDNC